jgi:phospholipid/cholesterol/gamma-HCH transport system substrate-binding protein
MAVRANYVKVGIFVLLCLGAATVLAIVTGVLRARRETDSYVSYFLESVQGLEVGAPVKARGVTIGRVGNISFAPDHQSVEVRSDLDVSTLEKMGFPKKRIPPDVRIQLASQGLVGTRFLSLDFFDPKTHPPPVLSFTPPPNYIPATPSLQKSLEDSVRTALDRLAQILDTVVREGVVEKVAQAVTRADGALAEVHRIIERVDREKLPGRAAGAIDAARAALDKMNKAVEHIDGQAGLIASAQRAVDSFNEVGRNASATTRDLEGTLDDIRATAAAIRSLAEELERNPDMLVKGIGGPRSP